MPGPAQHLGLQTHQSKPPVKPAAGDDGGQRPQRRPRVPRRPPQTMVNKQLADASQQGRKSHFVWIYPRNNAQAAPDGNGAASCQGPSRSLSARHGELPQGPHRMGCLTNGCHPCHQSRPTSPGSGMAGDIKALPGEGKQDGVGSREERSGPPPWTLPAFC